MSADSYGVCPRCRLRDPFRDWSSESTWTLRAYHEFYLQPDTREFTADYHGRCDDCGFDFQFHHKQTVEVSDAPES